MGTARISTSGRSYERYRRLSGIANGIRTTGGLGGGEDRGLREILRMDCLRKCLGWVRGNGKCWR